MPAGGRAERRILKAIGLAMTLAGALPAAQAQRQPADCAACHVPEATLFVTSVHHATLRCTECHGGKDVYELTTEQAAAFGLGGTTRPAGTTRPSSFDHGDKFRGRPARKDVPVLCGTCHADVERMNPYGLKTDQLAAYWLSAHGKQLKLYADESVAVCIDCHGTHDVLAHENAHSRTYFANIPATCGHCHANQALMTSHNLPADIVDQYKASVHGRNLLEKKDAGAPHCATCHGSHAAAPPGVAQVGQVCGRCHAQEADYVLSSVHGRIDVMARCTGCHGPGGNPLNHQIQRAAPPAAELVQTYGELRDELGDDQARLHERFVERVDAQGDSLLINSACRHCHGAVRHDPHAPFFEQSDKIALERGAAFATTLRQAQFEYAALMDRVTRMSHGVLLVRDEAVRAEDAKTEITALYPFLHTLNRPEIEQRAQKVKDICQEINGRLDEKAANLAWRHWSLYPIWGFIGLFFVLMYRKYLLLRKQYVRTPEAPSAPPSPARRRLLDATLRAMGAATVVALGWPAVAYVLPARKRGGGTERVSAGKTGGWTEWEMRPVVVAGKPVGVIRTDSGYRAFSLVCTHLGCVVHWVPASHEFHCPCHAAVFDATGRVVSGPAPRPLPELGASVVQDEVIVKAT